MRLRRRSPHVTVSIAVIMALGVGANVAIMTVLRDAIVGASLFTDVKRLVVLENRGSYDLGVRKVSTYELSWPDFEDLAAQQQRFSAIAGVTAPERTVWDTGARKRSVQRVFVTRELFGVLGVHARIGRTLSAADFDAGAPAALLVTASLWRAQLGGDPRAVGRVVYVDGVPFGVVGVIDDDVMRALRQRNAVFDHGDDDQYVIVPLAPRMGGRIDALMAVRRANRNRPMLTLVARLEGDGSLAQAQREVQLISRRLAQHYPDSNGERTIGVVSLVEWRTRAVRQLQPMLLAVGLLVWLAACASAAGLVVSDAIRGLPEMAVRHALGASRRTLARLVLWRSLEWTVPGGLLGFGLAQLAVTWLASGAMPARLRDPALVVWTAGLTALAGLVLGGIAVWVILCDDLSLGLKEAAHIGLPSRGRRVVLGVVISLHLAVATSLGLVCALLIKSMVNILHVDLGFDTGQTFMVRVFLPQEASDTAEAQSALFDNALTQIRSLPNVASAGMSSTPPLSGIVVTSGGDYALEVPGRPPKALGPLVTQYVSPGYFESIGMPLTRGRGFSADDYGGASPVIVVDEAFHRMHMPSVDPLTAGIRMDGTLFHIVGVVRDVRPDGPTGNVRATLYVLRDSRQPRGRVGHFVVRPSGRATPDLMDQVVRTVGTLDRRVVIDEPQMLDTLLVDLLAQRRRTLRMLVLAATVVFVLTAFSISGALSEFVANRTRELALRKALGASSAATARLLARSLAVPCLTGLIVGGFGAWLLTTTLSSELFGITPGDPAAIAATVVSVLAVAIAGAAPALTRAISIKPARALRAL